jgi:hypothetical protein
MSERIAKEDAVWLSRRSAGVTRPSGNSQGRSNVAGQFAVKYKSETYCLTELNLKSKQGRLRGWQELGTHNLPCLSMVSCTLTTRSERDVLSVVRGLSHDFWWTKHVLKSAPKTTEVVTIWGFQRLIRRNCGCKTTEVVTIWGFQRLIRIPSPTLDVDIEDLWWDDYDGIMYYSG